jgi:predicted nucleic acid-binding protein
MVIDTSVFIEFLRSKDKKDTTLYKLPDNTVYSLSAVTLFELFMGATTVDKKKDILLLTEGLNILSFNNDVAAKAGEIYHQLRKDNKMIEFRDIFIAATCIIYELPLVTLNIKHFSRIKDLTLT